MAFRYVFVEICLLVVSKLLCKISGVLFVLVLAQIQNGRHVIFANWTIVDSRYSSRVLYPRTPRVPNFLHQSSIENVLLRLHQANYVRPGLSDVVQCHHEHSPAMVS